MFLSTFTGKRIYPLDPKTDQICIEDIAVALARLVRYGGHGLAPYTVAEHCVHVSRIVPQKAAQWGLLHDAAEAYLGDLPGPIKKHPSMKAFEEMENGLLSVIGEKFGLSQPIPNEVWIADRRILILEMLTLFKNPPYGWGDIVPLEMKLELYNEIQARNAFMARFSELFPN